MTKKANPYLLYLYVFLFMAGTYFMRDLVSPTKNHFPLILQFISMTILYIVYKNTISNNQTVAGVSLFAFFTLFWEVTNFFPLLFVPLFTYLSVSKGIVLSLDWAFYVFKPLFLISFFWFNKTNFLLFFNTLFSQKTSDAPHINIEADQGNYISPEKATFYFNEQTQLLTIVYKKDKKSLLKYNYRTLGEDKNKFFFLNRKKQINPPINQLKLENDLLILTEKDKKIVFAYKELTSSMKEYIKGIMFKKEEQTYRIVEAPNTTQVSGT